MSWRRAALLLGAVAAVAVPAILPPSALAQATVTAVGWWNSSPVPGTPPEGGFEVGRAPTGATAVAALRIEVESPALTKALLTLNQADSSVGSDVASLKVCPTVDPWTPGSPSTGPAPKEACPEQPLLLAHDATAGTWSADVAPILPVGEGTKSLMILPGDDPLVYRLDFSGVVLQAEGAEPAAPAADSSSSSSGGSGSIATDSGFGLSSSIPDTSGLSTALPFDASTPAAFDPGTPQAAPQVTEANPNPVGTFPRRVDFQQRKGKPKPWGRLFFFVPLAALIGGAVSVSRRQLRQRGWAIA